MSVDRIVRKINKLTDYEKDELIAILHEQLHEQLYERLLPHIKDGDTGACHSILQNISQNSSINQMDSDGYTLLHHAATEGLADICEILFNKMDNSTILATTREYKYNALHCAILSEDYKTCKFFLDKWDPKLLLQKTCTGLNILDITMCRRNMNKLSHLIIERAPDVLLNLDNHPLLKIILYENLDICQLILSRMTKDDILLIRSAIDNHTVLHVAVKSQNIEIVKLILDHCPELANEYDKYHQSPLHHAVYHKNEEIVKILIPYMTKECLLSTSSKSYTLLHLASQSGCMGHVKLILEHCPELESIQDMYGQTPLFWAAAKGFLEICQCFGTQTFTIITANNSNIINCPAKNGHSHIIKYFLNNDVYREIFKTCEIRWSDIDVSKLDDEAKTLITSMIVD